MPHRWRDAIRRDKTSVGLCLSSPSPQQRIRRDECSNAGAVRQSSSR